MCVALCVNGCMTVCVWEGGGGVFYNAPCFCLYICIFWTRRAYPSVFCARLPIILPGN